jgi:hypothetical protein
MLDVGELNVQDEPDDVLGTLLFKKNLVMFG